MARPIIDLTDHELRRALDAKAREVVYSYNGVVAEMDRRAARRQATASFVLSALGLVIAVAALVVTALKS